MSRAPAAPTAAEAALAFVADGQVVGLGTGRAASAFVRALALRMKGDGLRVQGVPTSRATEVLARDEGIPLLDLADVDAIDVTVDGADEVDPCLDAIKGYGGALVREKVVAAASRRLVLVVGPEKLVARLGERGKLPVEVVPFAAALVRRRLAELGCPPELRRGPDGAPAVTDNGNWILDARIGTLEDPGALDRAILCIPGVVGTGLFVGMADAVVVAGPDGAQVRRRR